VAIARALLAGERTHAAFSRGFLFSHRSADRSAGHAVAPEEKLGAIRDQPSNLRKPPDFYDALLPLPEWEMEAPHRQMRVG
jgi:hypothetical protein